MEFLVRWRLLTGWRPYRALLGLLETTKLTKNNLGIEEMIKFIVHIHILIRAYTFDDSVMTQLMDSAAIRLLSVYFARTETAWIHPIEGCGDYHKSVGGTVLTPTRGQAPGP